MELCSRHQIEFQTGSYCPGCVAAMAIAENDSDDETPIATLGDYELIEEIGRGGMGVVYLARQAGLNRRVALKLLPSGSLAGNEFIQRFRREGELAASLQHPNIVRIFEAGQAEGELFYSMELIPGGSLADWRDGKTQRPMAAAILLKTLASAVSHAHKNGILHRDLKPANILIDDDGQPKVADFGLARAVESSGDLTMATQSFGSPAYMAPELIRDPKAATPASDIYSLGAILYFLLSGRSPFVAASLDELLRQVRECEPAPPRLLDPSVPRDLQKICLKALDKNPAKRYVTAEDLSDDLGRFIEGRPVIARPAGLLLKSHRLAKRSPWLTAAIVSLAIALIGGVAGIARQSKIANDRADEISRTAHSLRLNLYASDISAASLALQRGDTPVVNEILSRWEKLPSSDDPRGFEWLLLEKESQPAGHRRIDHREATVTSLAVSPTDGQIAAADQSGRILIGSTDGTGTRQSPPFSAEEVAAIPAKFGGGWVLGDLNGDVRWLDPSWKVIATAKGRQFSVAADAPRVIIGALPKFHWWMKAGGAFIMDWQTGEKLRDIPGEWRHAILSPDGRTAALADISGGLRLLNVDSGAVRILPTPSPVWALSFSKDGKKLAAGSRRSAILWDLTDPSPAPLVLPHDLTVWMTAFSDDGENFLTASSDRRVRVWRTENFSVSPTMLTGHSSEVWCAAFTRKGGGIVAGGKDGDVLYWELPARSNSKAVLIHDHPNPPFISGDGKFLMTVRDYRSVLLNLETNQEVPLSPKILGLGFSADGKSIIAVDGGGQSGKVFISDPSHFMANPTPTPAEMPRYFRCIGKGRWIARVENSGKINLLDPADGKTLHTLQGPPPGMRHVVVGSPDGQLVALGGDGENTLVLHDLDKHKAIRLIPRSTYYYVCAAFSKDGKFLAAGDLSGPIQIWETATGKLITSLPGHPEETSGVAFSPDGRTLASMGYHQDLKLWQTATWRELHSVNLTEAAYDLVFTPDGKSLMVTMGRLKNETIEWLPVGSSPAEKK